MKKGIRIFLIILVVITVIINGVWHFKLKHIEANQEKVTLPTVVEEPVKKPLKVLEIPDQSFSDILVGVQTRPRTDLLKQTIDAYEAESSRINFVVFAHDGTRADTIMFVSYDPSIQEVDVINIPRDTKWVVEGYTFDNGNQKINAVYGRGNGLGGSKGMKQAIADLLTVPVNYFVKINYNGAQEIIDTMGGVEIDVFKDLKYDDVYAEPELHIDIKAGLQVLDGKNSVDYLRWRKNNGEKNSDGDLPRIARLQQFLSAAVRQSINTRLPAVVNSCFQHVYTDIEFDLAASLAIKAVGIQDSNVNFKRLPGHVEGYFYVADQEEVLEYLLDMYKR